MFQQRSNMAGLPAGPTETVHFAGGPWNGQTAIVPDVYVPEFEAGDPIGAHYLLDTEHAPPTYHWHGPERL